MERKIYKLTIISMSIIALATMFLPGCEKKEAEGLGGGELFQNGFENLKLAESFSLNGWINLRLETEPSSQTRGGPTAGPMAFKIPYQGGYKKYPSSIRAQMFLDMNNMVMVGTSAPPPIIPEAEKVEMYLVDDKVYFEQMDGLWYYTPHDPSVALLTMNYGILPVDILRMMELPDEVEALEEADGYARYQLILGERYYQTMEEEAKNIFKGGDWQAKQQELARLKALLPNVNFLVYVDKESGVISKVEIRYGGLLSGLIGEQMPNVLKGMSFQMEGVFTFDFLKVFDIELPPAAKSARPLVQKTAP